MRRRRFLQATGLAGASALAGCTGTDLFEVRSSATRNPPVPDSRPNAVYYPSHVEGMEMAGTSGKAATDETGTTNGSDGREGPNESGGMEGSNGSSETASTAGTDEYAFALMYSYPHRFWTVTGSERSKTALQDADSLHLMASVWHPASGTVLPDTGLSVEITQDGDLVSQEVIYPMLSQGMGFHYGANFELPEEGTYTAALSVGAMSSRRTGVFQGLFSEPRFAEIDFEYRQSNLEEISFRVLEEKAGTKGAIEPMDMPMLPHSYAPTRKELPGRVLGEETTGDATLLATILDRSPEGVGKSGPYLALSARTPYNRLVIPSMALSGIQKRGSETRFEGELLRTLDPDLGYHYGAGLEGVRSGDELAIAVDTLPQVARHEGYETAFLDGMGEVSFTVP
ncbi:hypothetical protein BRC86_13510 [Halobacteriales archaeon QS_3_64_16]|nr:MAG: hypothetical protein BRC86_13510 [Halobacteriales archaeon QS_3_64_16]